MVLDAGLVVRAARQTLTDGGSSGVWGSPPALPSLLTAVVARDSGRVAGALLELLGSQGPWCPGYRNKCTQVHVVDEGVVVAGVVPNGPGARSGIQEGDVIVSLDAREVPTLKALYRSLWQHAPGEKMTLEVMRDNEVRRLSVTGGDRADFYKQIS